VTCWPRAIYPKKKNCKKKEKSPRRKAGKGRNPEGRIAFRCLQEGGIETGRGGNKKVSIPRPRETHGGWTGGTGE